MIEIPEQLKTEEFRFCLVHRGQKKPFEHDWNDKANYTYNDPKLIKHLSTDESYGVVCGHKFGRLIVIDFDDKELQDFIFPKLAKTFTVKSAGKGFKHMYYICDVPNQIKILGDMKRTLADIQGTTRTGNGSQVIGAGSYSSSGNRYEIIDDSPIARISQKELKELFKDYIIEEEVENLRKESEEFGKNKGPKDEVVEKIKSKMKVSHLLYKYGLNPNKISPKGNCECPLHTSTNHQPFSFDDNYSGGTFNCFHPGCHWKGDIFTLRMWKEECNFQIAKEKFASELGISVTPYQSKSSINTKKKSEEEAQEITDNVKRFSESNPFFYDKSKIFWSWNKNKFKYEITDETNILNKLEDFLSMNGNIFTTGLYERYIRSLESEGRKKFPKSPPLTWIQFKDKIIDIKDGKALSVTPEYFHTNPIPHKIGETEETPQIDKLLLEWVGSEYVRKLYEVIAYTLYRDYNIHAIFALIGVGRNGKGIYHRMIQNFVGFDNVCSSDIDSLINNRFESMNLYKKLVCFMGETNLRAQKESDKIKKISGHDLITFEKKNKDPISDFNYAKIIIASNGLPYFNDNSDGLAARFHIINFVNQFPEGQDVLARISEQEYENLGKKCLRILNELLAKGQFDKTGTIEDRKKRLDLASNPLPRFIQEWCETGNEDVLHMKPNELFAAYTKYIKMHKGVLPNKRQFYEALSREGYESELVRRGGDNQIGRYLLGIQLKKEWYECLKNNGEVQNKL